MGTHLQAAIPSNPIAMTSATTFRPSLTSNDSAVLQALFDAESSPSSGVLIDPSLPAWPAKVNISQPDLSSLKSREVDVVRQLQPEKNPSPGTIESAIEAFNTIINEYPTYPSAYINHAQVLRMKVDLLSNNSNNPDSADNQADALFTPQAKDLSSIIFADLGKAINMATTASPADPISPVQARLLADAHTHRGYILLKAARIKKSNQDETERDVGPDRLRSLGADQLEEMASHDFFLGGKYGNKIAQQLAVQTNPYAKMCGAIVKEAMRKEIEGEL